jgi:hypothetical protein
MQLRLVKQNISAPGHSEKQLPYRAVRPSPVADPIQVIITTGTPGYIQAKNPDFYTECRQAVHALLKVDVCVHGDCETARYLTPRGLRRTFDKYVQFPAGGNVRVEIPAEELYQRFELPQMPSFSRLLKQIPVSKPGEYRLRRGGTL